MARLSSAIFANCGSNSTYREFMTSKFEGLQEISESWRNENIINIKYQGQMPDRKLYHLHHRLLTS